MLVKAPAVRRPCRDRPGLSGAITYCSAGRSFRHDHPSCNAIRATSRLVGVVGLATGLVVSIGIAAPNIAIGQASQARTFCSVGRTNSGAGQRLLVGTLEKVVLAFGKASELAPPSTAARRIVGIASTPDSRGYWLVSSAGAVFAFGDATPQGSQHVQHLEKPIVAIASSPDGRGYWLVGSTGAVSPSATLSSMVRWLRAARPRPSSPSPPRQMAGVIGW